MTKLTLKDLEARYKQNSAKIEAYRKAAEHLLSENMAIEKQIERMKISKGEG